MNPLTGSHIASTALANTPQLSSLTLGQWLRRFDAVSTPAQILQVATSVEKLISSSRSDALEAAERDASGAAEYLRGLNAETHPELSEHWGRPITDFLSATTDLVRAGENALAVPDRAKTWAGRSQSLAGYIARTLGAHILHTSAADRYYRLTEERREEALSRYEFHAYERYPDFSERREAFERDHARNLEWAAGHIAKLLRLVPARTREIYDASRARLTDINEGYRGLLDLNDRLLQETDHLDPHEQNVRVNDREIEINRRIDALEKAIYEEELRWEVHFYEGLMEEARRFAGPLSERDEEGFAKALARFRKNAQTELDYRDLLLDNDKDATPNKRKNLEEAAYRSLMHDESTLHEAVRSIYRSIGHPAAAELESPPTFVWKNQAFRHSQGPADTVAVERLVESMIPFGDKIGAARKDPNLREMLDDVAACGWAIPALADYFEGFRLGAPGGFLGFGSQISPEASMIRGALALFGSNSNPIRDIHLNEWTSGIVSDQTHGDTMDYMAILASRYLLWGPKRWRPSIVAESVFKWIPYMGSYLKVSTGDFLSRSDKRKRERFLNVTAPGLIGQGRDVAQFGEGTRRLTNPFAARYSDLRHPGALHNPAEFLVPGQMRGMQFRLALANKADVHLYAAKIHGGGSGEPSIPRNLKGFRTPNYTEFSYRPPFRQTGFVALAGILRYRDLIKPEDFPGEPLHETYRRNVVVNRRILRRVGLNMDAGPRIT